MSWFSTNATRAITFEQSAAFYEAKGAAAGEQSDVDLRLCLLCGEEYPADDLCPCLPTEPPVEEYDVWMDR